MLTRKYERRVCNHLGMDKETFHKADWQAHFRELNKVDSSSMKNQVWGLHPCRQKLYQIGKNPSPLCPLCGGIDITSHYVSCNRLNSHPKVMKELGKLQSAGTKLKIFDHFIRLLMSVVKGETVLPEDQARDLGFICGRQSVIGWRHFLHGRITKDWGLNKPLLERRMASGVLVQRLASFFLQAMKVK